MIDINQAGQTVIAAIQLNSGEHIQDNLYTAQIEIKRAKNNGATCAVLPENFAWMGYERDANRIIEQAGKGIVQQFLQQTAKELGLWIIGGSHRILVPDDTRQRAYNTSLIYNPQGELVARSDKIHLFDADVQDGNAYLESAGIKAGHTTTLFDTGTARIGLTICYDLRFPALYHSLRKQGADVIVVPSAFTATTGKAHWKSLLRARAIENQVYIIAPAQCGTHPDGRQTWGHSLCVDPWGEVTAELADKPGTILCPIEQQKLAEVRQKMPVLAHQKPASY